MPGGKWSNIPLCLGASGLIFHYAWGQVRIRDRGFGEKPPSGSRKPPQLGPGRKPPSGSRELAMMPKGLALPWLWNLRFVPRVFGPQAYLQCPSPDAERLRLLALRKPLGGSPEPSQLGPEIGGSGESHRVASPAVVCLP